MNNSIEISTSTGVEHKPLVGVLMGSSSDWHIMQYATKILQEFNISFEAKVISAHRMPDEMFSYAQNAYGNGIKAIIAGAGGAAHLAGMLASKTIIPVFGVPIPSKYLAGLDSLYSIVQMPKGVPVATFAIGEAGATNAALHVIANLAMYDKHLYTQLLDFKFKQTQNAIQMQADLS